MSFRQIASLAVSGFHYSSKTIIANVLTNQIVYSKKMLKYNNDYML